MVHPRRQKTFIIYTPAHLKDRTDLNVYAIYPDYWGEAINLGSSFKNSEGRVFKYRTRHNWGEVPCLGYVKETSEYWAEKAAHAAGILPVNFTFGPRAVQIRTKLSDLKDEVIKHEIRRKTYGKKHHPNSPKK